MLTTISLCNYKSFKDSTEIPIKPLTILCGANSSGKSSITKSALMMKQTVEKDSPYNKLSFMGSYVDNGYWDDIINFDSAIDEKAVFTISNTFVLKMFDAKQKSADIIAYKELTKLYAGTDVPHRGSFKITHTVTVGKPDQISENTSGFAIYINNNFVKTTEVKIDVLDECDRIITGLTGSVSIDKKGNTERDYDLNYQNIPHEGELVSAGRPLKNCKCYFSNIKLTNFYKEHISSDVVAVKSTILAIFNIASMQYSSINYIAPLRQSPLRSYTVQGDVDSVGRAGENVPILYAKHYMDSHRRDIRIPFLKEGKPIIDFTNKIDSGHTSLHAYVQSWLDYFDMGELSLIGDRGLLSLTLNGHNIADVGFGMSQVLPIIIQGLHMQKQSTLLLEQPEIHLHPKAQMNIADFLLAVAESGRQIIVETHSDHIINRITRRVMETMGTENDLSGLVQIYFVSQDEHRHSTLYRDIKIDPVRGLIDCPPEFFRQYANELRVTTKQGLSNARSSKGLK